MKRFNILFPLTAIFLVFLVLCNAYEYTGYTDTSNGYCETKRFGRIPVGETYYSDDDCERIICSNGHYTGQGCGQSALLGSPNCHLVRRSGHYPDCCRSDVVCAEGDDPAMSSLLVCYNVMSLLLYSRMEVNCIGYHQKVCFLISCGK
ncbi:Toxin-like protein 14 like protein [Argiope bruennichi]|uniref:Toxin-like protein 14 like protein n=1 Tax=Argiope bruennichi TaxID=94029 RepID=A0A8T0F801_ARGBR|nr:Toxin-like protein 14 like protein [Argiope bruennichi]